MSFAKPRGDKLKRNATPTQVCTWFASINKDLSVYFPRVLSCKINADAVYTTPVTQLLATLNVSSLAHRLLLEAHIQMSKGEGLTDSLKQVLDAGPVAERNLNSPRETRDWLVLKQGYLKKTKQVKRGLIKSVKLRWFVLKQNPVSLKVHLEYYEGMALKGSANLDASTSVMPDSNGAFTIEVPGRVFYLQAEGDDFGIAMSWIVAIQSAVHSKLEDGGSGSEPKPAPEPSAPEPEAPVVEPPGDDEEGTPAARLRNQTEELDGNAIDAARWAALRRRAEEDMVSVEEDDDVRWLREMEEEEERRQEEERQAFLAERAAQKAAKEAQNQSQEPVEEPVQEEPTNAVDDDGNLSEDEEEILRQMREAEEEEERRQEEERQAFLAERAAKKAAEAAAAES